MNKHQGRKRLNVSGFTLIEVLVTLAILGIVIIPLSGVFVQAVKVNGEAKERLISTQIAQRYLERYKSKSHELISSVVETNEIQDTDYPDYHVQVVISPYTTGTVAAPTYNYKYPAESDVLPNIDMYVVFNDDDGSITEASEKNSLFVTKNGGTKFFSMSTGSSDAVFNVTVNSGTATPNTTFTGTLSGDSMVVEDATQAFDLVESQFSTNQAENIRVEINTNKNLTINAKNLLTKTTNNECIFYIVHKNGKTGNVTGNVLGGKVDFIKNLYDKSIVSGLPEHGLYKITVTVYKGMDSTTGKRLYRLESFLK